MRVGVTTFITTVPTGVSLNVFSFCVQLSEPGATPGHMFSVCEKQEAERKKKRNRKKRTAVRREICLIVVSERIILTLAPHATDGPNVSSALRSGAIAVKGARLEVGSIQLAFRTPRLRLSSARELDFQTHFPPARNIPICSFRNFSSAGLPPAPAVCPHNDGIGTSETFGMNVAS